MSQFAILYKWLILIAENRIELFYWTFVRYNSAITIRSILTAYPFYLPLIKPIFH